MRTTLTLDDDVAVLLERVRKARQLGLKEAVNEALRQGLKEMTTPSQPRKVYQTRSVSLGRCLPGNLDDVFEALAIAEGEDFR